MAISCFAARSSLAARCSRGVAGQGQYRQYPRRRRRPAPGVAVQWVNVTALGVGSCGRRRATVRRKSIPTVGLLHAWRARRSRSLRVNWLGVPGNWAACLRRSTWRNQARQWVPGRENLGDLDGEMGEVGPTYTITPPTSLLCMYHASPRQSDAVDRVF